MKKFIIAGVLAVLSGSLFAQQLPQYTQYQLNSFVVNPAIAGTQGYWQAKSNNRYQWSGINDAPRTYIFSLYGPLLENMGIGGYLLNDVTGPTRNFGAQAAYSYRIKVMNDLNLSFGVSLGVLYSVVDGGKITTAEIDDIALSNGLQSKLNPDAGGGVYLYNDKWYFGLSAPQLITSRLNFFEDYEESVSRLERHYMAMGGYKFTITDEIDLEASSQVKFVPPVVPQIDVGLRAIYEDMLWLGVNYRTAENLGKQEALGVLAGYTFQENITFAYSYDIPLSTVSQYTSGSHEIMFALRFKNRKTNF